MLTRKTKRKYKRKIIQILLVACSFVLISMSDFVYAHKREHTAFFEGTDYELHVYRIFGKEPGKTLLLIGGIQGDEPGGFLSADLYADFSLAKGNLIVVPRANFQSIVLRRRKINEDMNRKFAEDKKNNYETRVVGILKKLISESDCLLNLHDGSGFYSDKWEGPNRNPKRYGQSVIADCETYITKDKSKTIELGKIAREVLKRVNQKINNPKHHIHFNNHRTSEQTSSHKEQRKSATYYALYSCEIPAFGIESSKSLPLKLKVLHHNLAINAFMEKFNIIPETPGIYLDPPILKYLIVSINDSPPTVVANLRTLNINYGDSIHISTIATNYERGLSADIIGFGTINDVKKSLKITKPTRVVVRKDYYPCGSIYIALSGRTNKLSTYISKQIESVKGPEFLYHKIKINGKEQIHGNYAHIKLIKGDLFEIEDVITNLCDPSSLEVNFKGYVGDQANNTGEDRGYAIDTGKSLWKRYSIDKQGKHYQIIVTHDKIVVGKLFLDFKKPIVKYMVFGNGSGRRHCYSPGETISINETGKIKLIDVITNVEENSGIQAYLACGNSLRRSLNLEDTIEMNRLPNLNNGASPSNFSVEVQRGKIAIGSVLFKIVRGKAS